MLPIATESVMVMENKSKRKLSQWVELGTHSIIHCTRRKKDMCLEAT